MLGFKDRTEVQGIGRRSGKEEQSQTQRPDLWSEAGAESDEVVAEGSKEGGGAGLRGLGQRFRSGGSE